MTTTITITGWEIGSFDSDGEDYYREDRLRTSCVEAGGSLIIFNIELSGGNAEFVLSYFNNEDRHIGSNTDWLPSGTQVRLPDNVAWFKIVVHYTDNRTMSPSNILRSEYVFDPWYVSQGKLKHDILPDLIEPRLSPPYPPEIWTVIDGRLTHGGLIGLQSDGAFADCTSLVQVSIPRTMETIGAQSFINTGLTAVTIPRNCEYSDTTFPPRCIINYYSE